MSILDRHEPRIPLPKAWPRLARSAILHAAALAHLVVTHVRGWCCNSPEEPATLPADRAPRGARPQGRSRLDHDAGCRAFRCRAGHHREPARTRR